MKKSSTTSGKIDRFNRAAKRSIRDGNVLFFVFVVFIFAFVDHGYSYRVD